jgi:hypothetical protein
VKQKGQEIVTAPSVAKNMDDMVGKNAAMNYEFPDNNEIDSDKVSPLLKSSFRKLLEKFFSINF